MANKEHLRLWVEDLESGKHAQTCHLMARQGDPPSYCCLGRACEVAIENGVEIVRTESSTKFPGEIRYDDHGGSYVPPKIATWLDISAARLENYAVLNDRGMTFNEIAAHIREDFDL